MIARYINLIGKIQALEFLNEKTTGHNIAKNIKSVSRSTTYRDIRKARELGLIACLYDPQNNSVEWFVTGRGNEFYRSQMEIPF